MLKEFTELVSVIMYQMSYFYSAITIDVFLKCKLFRVKIYTMYHSIITIDKNIYCT